jgi:proteasome assembly chaperone (PAC2) family protein
MTPDEILTFKRRLKLQDGTLMLAFSGWMDGGEVSTGTVQRLIDLLDASPFAQIDPEPFYIYNFPGTMEISALFRPHIEIEDGLLKRIELPSNTFYCHEPANLVLFVGKEPNLQWRMFGDAVFQLARELAVKRILFVGSFGGTVPHTREPRLYVTCSDPKLLPEMEQYGVGRTGYEGPGSFTTYLMSRAPEAEIEMASLVAEIPAYLQGSNPMCIAAVTRRLAKMFQLPLDVDGLRTASTEWELDVSKAIEQDEEMSEQVKKLEEDYDNELIESDSEET